MKVIYLSTDLMFGIRVKETAERAGVELKTVANAAAFAQAVDGTTNLALLDLSSAGSDLEGLVAACRAANSSIQIVAYGPHVNTRRLDAARAAGCDSVISNGQFNAEMETVLRGGLG